MNIGFSFDMNISDNSRLSIKTLYASLISETQAQFRCLAMILTAIIAATLAISFVSPFPACAISLSEANQQASEASSAYDSAVAARDDIQRQLDDATAKVEQSQMQVDEKRNEMETAAVESYKHGNAAEQFAAVVLSGATIEDVVSSVSALLKITGEHAEAVQSLEAATQELMSDKAELETAKSEADAAVSEAESAKIAALDAQEEARAAAAKTQASSVSATRAPTSSVAYDEASARAWIVNKESGGNYNARNGRYIGAYQLTDSYLNGDYSPANQDRVAEQYVKNRYGSWMGAVAFWQSHGWY